jgi:hypothetical protein
MIVLTKAIKTFRPQCEHELEIDSQNPYFVGSCSGDPVLTAGMAMDRPKLHALCAMNYPAHGLLHGKTNTSMHSAASVKLEEGPGFTRVSLSPPTLKPAASDQRTKSYPRKRLLVSTQRAEDGLGYSSITSPPRL